MNLQIDQYAHLDSLVHRWHPCYKLVGLAGLIFAFAVVESLALVPPMVGVTAILYATSRLPLSFLRSRLRYPGFFLIGIVVLLPWFAGDTVLWQWGWVSLRLEGLLSVVLIASRFFCILTVGVVMLGTMPFLTTIKALRSLGLPAILTDMTLLTYRYLYDVSDNLMTMRRAMGLRGFGQRAHRSHSPLGLPSLRDLNLLASLTGSLFIRSYERSESIYRAMRLRGYGRRDQPRSHALTVAYPLSPHWDRTLLGSMLAIALLFTLAEIIWI